MLGFGIGLRFWYFKIWCLGRMFKIGGSNSHGQTFEVESQTFDNISSHMYFKNVCENHIF
jgi:hypothetical protein